MIGYDNEFDYSGNFLLTARVGENAGKLYQYSGDVKISDNTVYIQGKQLNYIYYLLTNYNLQKLAFGTGQPLIKASELNNLKLMLSNNNDEQAKIGTYFKNLDKLISSSRRRSKNSNKSNHPASARCLYRSLKDDRIYIRSRI